MDEIRAHGSGYRQLDVYVKSHALAVAVHKATLGALPKFEMYEEGSQVRRSSKSIVASIVEGYGRRRYKADYIRFLVAAHASCDETMAHLRLLEDTGSLDAHQARELLDAYDHLGRQLSAFIAAVERGHQANRE